MKNNAKFDRLVNIRTRSSDLRLFLLAVAAAVAAHFVFFGLFSRVSAKKEAADGDTYLPRLSMLTLKDLPASRRKGFSSWLEYHEPRGVIRGNIDDAAIGGVLRDVRPPKLKSDLGGAMPIRPAAVGKFSEVPGSGPQPRHMPPSPPRRETAPVAVSSGGVTDGEGNVLPHGDLKLPPRTPLAVGRTVLRVFNGGDTPALLLESSCGDGKLDDFALRSLAFLTRGELTPEFMIVEWPEAEK